jgi:type II secretory pathway pseudopilin PulG
MKRSATRRREGGFTYLLLLFAVVSVGIALARAGEVWSTHARRENEAQLLFAGEEIRRAIESYAAVSGGLVQAEQRGQLYPRSLAALLEDRRGPTLVRHLRRVYADPFTGSVDWGLVTNAGGGIIGVFSHGEGRPLMRAGFPSEQSAGFAAATSYRDWQFVARGATQAPTRPAGAAPPGLPSLSPAAPAASPAASVVVTAPEPEEEIPEPPPMRELEKRTREACEQLRRFDEFRCTVLLKPTDAEGRSACARTLVERSAACLSGEQIPSLAGY